MRYRFDWIVEQLIIACRADFEENIEAYPANDVLVNNPEAYFCGEDDFPPSMPMRGYIEVSVPNGVPIGFDLRKITDLNCWTVQIDDGNLSTIESGTTILTVPQNTQTVLFLWNGKKHTMFKLFHEENFDNEGTDKSSILD